MNVVYIQFQFPPPTPEHCHCRNGPPDKWVRDRSPRHSSGPIVECQKSAAVPKRLPVGIVPACGRVRDSTSQRLLPAESGPAVLHRFPRMSALGWEDHRRSPPWFGPAGRREDLRSKYWWIKSAVSHRMTGAHSGPRGLRQSASHQEPVPGARPVT